MHLFKNTLFALLFVALFSNTYAQTTKSLIDNPDISWVAEAYTYYAPSANSLDLGKEEMKKLYHIEERNSARLLKLVDVLSDDNLYASEKELATFMLHLDASKVKVYTSSDLERTYTAQEYENKKSAVDTIITFDPQTYEEIVQVIVSAFDEGQVEVFKVKQLIYYNDKTKQLNSVPVAIAPMLTLLKNTGGMKVEAEGYMELFWLPITALQKPLKLSNNNYNYAIRMTRNINEKEMKVVKGEWTLGQVVKDMVADGANNPTTTKMYQNIGYMEAMSPEEVQNFGNSVDTIITFDPNTFEEIVQVVTDAFDAKEVKSLRLVQDWVWDAKAQQLNVRLIAYAPVQHPKDNKGWLKTLFYKKPWE